MKVTNGCYFTHNPKFEGDKVTGKYCDVDFTGIVTDFRWIDRTCIATVTLESPLTLPWDKEPRPIGAAIEIDF